MKATHVIPAKAGIPLLHPGKGSEIPAFAEMTENE